MSIKKTKKNITKITKYYKNTNTGTLKKKSSSFVQEINEEFNATLTQAEKDAPYYTDWSDKRLGELAVLNFKIINHAFENLSEANTKSIIVACHILNKNNIENININLHLEAIYTDVGGHFIDFNIRKMSKAESEQNDIEFEEKTQQGIEEEIVKENTTKIPKNRKIIEGSLYNSLENIGLTTRKIFNQLETHNKDKKYCDKECVFMMGFLLTSAMYNIGVNSGITTHSIGQLKKSDENIPNSSYEAFIKIKNLTLNSQQKKQRA